MAVLSLLANDGSGRAREVFALVGNDVLVGRGEAAQLTLIDESVSRQHARLQLRPQGWMVSTLNAANPVRINGQAVGEVLLAAGTVLEIGRLRLRFELEDPRASSTVYSEGTPSPVSSMSSSRPGSPASPSFERGGASGHAATVAARPRSSVPGAAFTPAPLSPPPTHVSPAPPPASAPPRTPGPPAPAPTPPAPAAPAPAPPGSQLPSLPPQPMVAPSSNLRTGRRWGILFGVLAIGLGTAGWFARGPIGDWIESLRDDGGTASAAPTSGSTSPESTASDSGEATAPSQTSGDAPVPKEPAVVPPPAEDAPRCPRLDTPAPGTDLGRIVEVNGPPSSFTYARSDSGSASLMVRWPRLGQTVKFIDGRYRGGLEGPPSTAHEPIPSTIQPWAIDKDLDARCIVRALGPAHLMLPGAPLPTTQETGGAAMSWLLERGGFMVTLGNEIRVLQIGGKAPGLEARGESWMGAVEADVGGKPHHASVVLHHDDDRWTVDLFPHRSTPEAPGVSWVLERPEFGGGGTLELQGRDTVDGFTGLATAIRPTAMMAELQHVDGGGRMLTWTMRGPAGERVYRGYLRPMPWTVN